MQSLSPVASHECGELNQPGRSLRGEDLAYRVSFGAATQSIERFQSRKPSALAGDARPFRCRCDAKDTD